MKFAIMFRCLSFLLIAALLFFTSSCKKDLLQLQKVQQLNSNTTLQLNNVKFIDDTTCIAAGGDKYLQSVIIRSVDGGYTWTAESNPDAQKAMFGMSISPNGTIYLSGVDGDVLHSKDSGKTWQFNRVLNWLFYLNVTFPSPGQGLLVSTTLQRLSTITRVDSNFNIIDEKNFLFGLNNLYMNSPTTGYVIGYGAVMKTTDGGNTWLTQSVEGDNFLAMDIHGEEMWLCGYEGSIFHTTNGGDSWHRLRNGNDITIQRYRLLNILFKDSINGWAIGENGRLIGTDDGGNHWEEYANFTSNALRSMVLCPNGDLLICGDNGSLFRVTP